MELQLEHHVKLSIGFRVSRTSDCCVSGGAYWNREGEGKGEAIDFFGAFSGERDEMWLTTSVSVHYHNPIFS
uniref:Uncharacterized protein n=1 Tax=Strigamia maritima TaxID=126957 RepID=T1IV99_STRMM